MDKITGGLTVFFEHPFWIGIFEHIENGKFTVCKVTFGAEPKNYEIYDFIIKKYYQLKFSSAVDVVKKENKIN
ncbi:MAG: YjdF family protein, partial [Ruminococcus sp.]|nr:YjdF family protein [Ruminococcus sp.]